MHSNNCFDAKLQDAFSSVKTELDHMATTPDNPAAGSLWRAQSRLDDDQKALATKQKLPTTSIWVGNSPALPKWPVGIRFQQWKRPRQGREGGEEDKWQSRGMVSNPPLARGLGRVSDQTEGVAPVKPL